MAQENVTNHRNPIIRHGSRWAIVVGILAFVVVATRGGGNTTQTTADASAQQTAQQPDTPPMPVAIADISRAYADNELAADDKYKGPPLLVTATIGTVSTDLMGNPDFVVDTPSDGSDVVMSFDKSDGPTLAGFHKGERHTFVCTDDGKHMAVLLNCNIVK